jgi:hypothetical protein
MATTNAQSQPDPDSTDLVKAEDLEIQKIFRKEWPTITSPEPQTLFGFRRFQTTHLLNLRLLENEILALDHKVFQAGLSLGGEVRSDDLLALAHIKRDVGETALSAMDKGLTNWLRGLLKEYGKFDVLQVRARDQQII